MCRGIVVVPLHLRREKPILVALACAQHAETEAAPAACASFLSLSHTYTLSLSHILIHRSVRRQLSLALSLILSLSHTLWTVDCGVWCFSIASRSPAAATTAAATHTHTHTHTYTHTHTHTTHYCTCLPPSASQSPTAAAASCQLLSRTVTFLASRFLSTVHQSSDHEGSNFFEMGSSGDWSLSRVNPIMESEMSVQQV